MMPFAFKIAILVILGLIILSLMSGMLFMTKDDGRGTRLVSALTFRIVLSISLFTLLLAGYLAGWIQPHGLQPLPPQ